AVARAGCSTSRQIRQQWQQQWKQQRRQRRQQRQWPQVWQQPVECLNQSNSSTVSASNRLPCWGNTLTASVKPSGANRNSRPGWQPGGRAQQYADSLGCPAAVWRPAASAAQADHDQREEPRAGGRGQDQCRARAGQAAGRGEAGRRCRCKGRRGLGPHEALHRGGRGTSGSTGRARRHAGAAAEARGGRAQQQRRQPQPAAARERRAEEPAAGACR
ncbi:hypothetical protein COO60DRAFT_1698599, partial [Scenedesmus sp. NREL 46B-D3]